MRTFTITGTGTGVGKTFFTRGLAAALSREGRRVAALKPYETGCAPSPRDAEALARACGRPELANTAGFYRTERPLSPYAATLEGAPPPPPIARVVESVRAAATGVDVALVEGAGGLFVPLDAAHTFADFAAALGAPLLIVAADALGTLSHSIAAVRAARAAGLDIRAIVLSSAHASADDPSPSTNTLVLESHVLPLPVLRLAPCEDDDDALADAVQKSGVFTYLT